MVGKNCGIYRFLGKSWVLITLAHLQQGLLCFVGEIYSQEYPGTTAVFLDRTTEGSGYPQEYDDDGDDDDDLLPLYS